MQIADIIQPHLGQTGGVLSALRAIQEEMGYLPGNTETVVADQFNLSRAEVKGIISFYSDFRRQPVGAAHIRLCAAEACQAVGGRELVQKCEKAFDLKMGNTAQDGTTTLEPVYCLGLCSVGPAAMVNDHLIGYADESRIKDMASSLAKKRAQ